MLHTSNSKTSGRIGSLENLEKRELMAADFAAAAPSFEAALAGEPLAVQVADNSDVGLDTLPAQNIVGEIVNGRSPDKDGKGCTEHDIPSIPPRGTHKPFSMTVESKESDRGSERFDEVSSDEQRTVAAFDAAFSEDYGRDVDDANEDLFGQRRKKDGCNPFKKVKINRHGLVK